MDDPKRARSRKRRIRPRIALPNVAPVLYSTDEVHTWLCQLTSDFFSATSFVLHFVGSVLSYFLNLLPASFMASPAFSIA